MLAGCLVITGGLMVIEVDADLVGSSALVAMIVYFPALSGEVQTSPANDPDVAVHRRTPDEPPRTVALNVCRPGAIVWFAGVIEEISTASPTTNVADVSAAV
jgi:hypothetical protein